VISKRACETPICLLFKLVDSPSLTNGRHVLRQRGQGDYACENIPRTEAPENWKFRDLGLDWRDLGMLESCRRRLEPGAAFG